MSHPGVVVVVVADSGLPQDTQDEKSDDSCVCGWLQWSRDEMVQMITDDKTAERKRKKKKMMRILGLARTSLKEKAKGANSNLLHPPPNKIKREAHNKFPFSIVKVAAALVINLLQSTTVLDVDLASSRTHNDNQQLFFSSLLFFASPTSFKLPASTAFRMARANYPGTRLYTRRPCTTHTQNKKRCNPIIIKKKKDECIRTIDAHMMDFRNGQYITPKKYYKKYNRRKLMYIINIRGGLRDAGGRVL